jgi:tyrosine-protein phosphatase SIW14
MLKSIAILPLYLSILILSGCAGPKMVAVDRPSGWSQKIDLDGFSNIYKIDEHVYRSEQPHSDEMITLNEYGIKSVLNLRSVRNDNREAKGTTLTLHHVPINTWRMSYEDLIKSLVILENSDKPVLVHCLHGSDRTGCVIAAYRMIHYGWTKEEAIKELVEGGYGYHAKWFPNILELINSLDVEKLKKDVQIASGF